MTEGLNQGIGRLLCVLACITACAGCRTAGRYERGVRILNSSAWDNSFGVPVAVRQLPSGSVVAAAKIGENLMLRETDDLGATWHSETDMGVSRILDIHGGSMLCTESRSNLVIRTFEASGNARTIAVKLAFAGGRRPWSDDADISDREIEFKRGALLVDGTNLLVAVGPNRVAAPWCVARSPDGGETWNEAAVLDVNDTANWGCNAMYLVRQGEVISLFARRSGGGVDMKRFISRDGGTTWQNAELSYDHSFGYPTLWSCFALRGTTLGVGYQPAKAQESPDAFVPFYLNSPERTRWRLGRPITFMPDEPAPEQHWAHDSRVQLGSKGRRTILSYPQMIARVPSETLGIRRARRRLLAGSTDGGMTWRRLDYDSAFTDPVSFSAFAFGSETDDVLGIVVTQRLGHEVVSRKARAARGLGQDVHLVRIRIGANVNHQTALSTRAERGRALRGPAVPVKVHVRRKEMRR